MVTQCCPSRQERWYQNNIIVTYVLRSFKLTLLHEDKIVAYHDSGGLPGAGFLLIVGDCAAGTSGSFPDGAGVGGKGPSGEGPFAIGACPAAPVLLLRALCSNCIPGLGRPGGP